MSNGINIVTGYTGSPHIWPQHDRYIHQASLGSGTYILPTGNQMDLQITDATQVTLLDGGLSLQGCVAIIDAGATNVYSVESGTAGYKRIDYLIARYTKNSKTFEEDVELAVITGTPVTGTPTPPTYTSGSIEDGDTTVEAPIWKINIDGLTVASVERVAQVVSPLSTLMSSMSGFTNLLEGKAAVYYFTSGNDVNTAREDMALRACFMFQGGNSFSQDVLGLETQVNAFGIGFKNSSTSVALLTICGGRMYYSTYSNTGAGTIYNPLVLTTNV